MSSEILTPNGNPAQKQMSVPALDLPLVGKLPFRMVPLKEVIDNKMPPKDAVIGTVQQSNDQSSIALAGMYLLAKDLYSRYPEGSRHFQDFCEAIGLHFTNLEGSSVDPVEDMKSIL